MFLQTVLTAAFIAGSLNAAYVRAEVDVNDLEAELDESVVVEDDEPAVSNETEIGDAFDIINGKSDISRRPYQAAIFLSKKFHGSGAILSNRFIVTKAFLPEEKKRLTVGVGQTKISNLKKKLEVEEVIVHPKYTFGTENHVSILRLKKALKFTKHVRAIKLPTKVAKHGSNAIASGWDSKEDESDIEDEKPKPKPHKGDLLQEEKQKVLDHENCKKLYVASFVSDTTICGSNSKTKLSEGSPLVQDNSLIGLLLSHPKRPEACVKKEHCPPVYTDIFEVRDWIKKTIKK